VSILRKELKLRDLRKIKGVTSGKKMGDLEYFCKVRPEQISA